MLSFSVEAAQDELSLLIRRGNSILLMPRGNVPQVELVMRSESEWLREVYDALILVFHKTKQSDLLFETGPHHPRGAISVEIGEHFEKRMRNRLNMLDRLCREMAPT